MKTIYIERLKKFASHLEKIHNHPEQGLFKTVTIAVLEKHANHLYSMKYPNYIIDELVAVFDEWEFSEFTGEPILAEPYKSEGTFEDLCDFFDLSLDEISFFDLEGFHQVDKFGGKVLSFDSTPQDFAFNLYELVKFRALSNK